MKKVLFVATVVRLHINMFHKPFIKWFHDQGWQVDVAANNDYENKDDCVIPYCDHFYCLPFERSPFDTNNLQAYRQLEELVEKNQYDIVHCHTPVGGVLTRLACSKMRKKGTTVIYTAHGFHFFKGAPVKNWLIFYPIEKVLSYKTDLLITINQEDYHYAKSFHAKKVANINGVGLDLSKYSRVSNEKRKEIRAELGLADQDCFIISSAQLIKRKNHAVLIEAISKLNDPNAHLFICGDGPEESSLHSYAEKLGVNNQVHFLGFRKDIYELCGAADIFAMASTQEGLSVAVMEAMACELPLVVSDIRGNNELIDNGRGGYLVDPQNSNEFAEKIKRLVNDKMLREEYGRYNHNKIQGYGIDSVMEQITALYKLYM